MALPFSRHDLAWVSEASWPAWCEPAPDAEAAACLQWWAAHRLPLVVSRQAPGDPGLALGLPAPNRWGRRKLSLHAERGAVVARGHFRPAADAAPLLPAALQDGWRALCRALAALGCAARVHGSHGWQLITGLDHLRESSDLDLLLPVDGAAMADAVCARLAAAAAWPGPRIDGELLLPGGAGVAWREWQAWRAGTVGEVMVKRIDGVALARGSGWLAHEFHRVGVPA